MSLKVMSWAWDLPLRATEKILLLAIADAANDDGFAYPGYERLMKKTGLGRATLAKQLKILAEAGLFTKSSHGSIGKGRKVNNYQLNLLVDEKELVLSLEKARKNNAESYREGSISSPPEPSISSPPELENNDAISSHPELRKVHPPNAISSPPEHEQSVEQSVKQRSVKKDSKRIADDEILLSFGIAGVIASDFIKFRKSKGAAITETAMNGLAREAKKAGLSNSDAAAYCIEANWQGFRADWYLKREQKTPPAGQAKAGFIGNQPTKRNIPHDNFDSKDYGQSTFELPWESTAA